MQSAKNISIYLILIVSVVPQQWNCSSTLDLNSDLFNSMIYIERHIAGSLNLEMYVWSEFTWSSPSIREGWFQHTFIFQMFYLQKYGILKFVAPETYCMLKLWSYPFLLFVILQKTQLDLFRNKFVHINVITLKSNFKIFLDRVWVNIIRWKCEQKLANGFE